VPQACYRELRHYKYQLMEDYLIPTPIRPPQDISLKFLSLSAAGDLTIRKSYAWDGASGPAIDTRNIMRGSLVHDALYQLMRLSKLDYQAHREAADDFFRQICLQDGMSSVRAWYVHQAVRLFGESRARPTSEPEVVVICVP